MRNRYFFIIDIVFLPLAVYFSYVLRLETLSIHASYQIGWIVFTLITLCIFPLTFRFLGLYSRYWQYASIEDLILLIGMVLANVLLTTILSVTIDWLLPYQTVLPRSIPIIFILLAIPITTLSRFGLRIFQVSTQLQSRRVGQPVLIIGANRTAEKVAREIQETPILDWHLIGFVDENPQIQGMFIHGVPVLGGLQLIPHVVKNYKIKQIIIVLPDASGSKVREILQLCDSIKVSTKIIPSLHSLLDGSISVHQLRDVNIEDLLRRTPIQTDITAVSNMIHNQKVLVTGAGGSIGSELCRQLLSFHPAALILVGHGENSIFNIYHELLPFAGSTKLIPLIADVRFPQRLKVIFETYRPDMVYHAAAHKHVPLMEHNPCEAITNNVIGTRNVLQAAQAVQVKRFVMISTDKAVNPTSIMGASKRTAEFLVHQAAQQSGRAYVAVRFGNVLGSRGSVVLTFKQQIAQGGPITVTHPDITRFFMTIPEAVQLVLQASVLGQGGEVFVLDMGEPIKIIDLAKDLIELSGLKVGQDIEIQFTGLRPGEKLYEELFIPGENYHRTQHEKIFIAENASHFMPENVNEKINTLWQIAEKGDRPALIHQLQQLIPELKITIS